MIFRDRAMKYAKFSNDSFGGGGPDFKAVANRFGTYPTSSLLETRVSMFVLE